MYSPQIPWESLPGTNFRQYPHNITAAPIIGDANTRMSAPRILEKDDEEKPPQIPQRQNSPSSQYLSQSPYLSGYNGGLYNNPYQSQMYGGNTGGLYGYSNMGPNMGPNNMMFQNNSMFGGLENASQNAFQSAQTFIGAFSSVSMMLESTLFAVQNSVRAIASVANQFGHLRNQIFHTSYSFLRILRRYIKKILVLFKLRTPDKNEEKYWIDAMSGVSPHESKQYASLLFFCVLIATPWIIWRFLRAVNNEYVADNKWFQGSSNHFVAEVKFAFTARNTDELTITPNKIIRLAPKNCQPNTKGWLLASDGETQGLVPANYIKILGKNRKDITTDVSTEDESPVINKKNEVLESVFENEKNELFETVFEKESESVSVESQHEEVDHK